MPTLRTVTIKSSGGTYTTLSDAVLTEVADLIALDRKLRIEWYDVVDTGGATISPGLGWTADATRYIEIEVVAANRHQGKPGTSTGRLRGNTISCSVPYTKFIGLEVDGNSGGNNGLTLAATGIEVSDFLIHDCSNGSAGNGISVENYATTIHDGIVYNCRRGIYAAGAAPLVEVYNVTAVDNLDYGLLRCKYVNCISYGHSDGDFFSEQTGSDYNLSSDASPSIGTHNRINKTLTFENASGHDFHLAAGDTDAIGYGIGPASDANVRATDLDGDTRSGATCDMGADEYEAEGGPVAVGVVTMALRAPVATASPAKWTVIVTVAALAIKAPAVTMPSAPTARRMTTTMFFPGL